MSSKAANREVTAKGASYIGLGIGRSTLLYFALSFAYFLTSYLPGQHLFGTDYLAGGYFFYEFISDELATGNIPGWVPYIFGGLPLAANPGSAFYPVRLIADLLLPVTWILPTIFVFQFGIAGLGMHLLALELRCRRWVAMVAGIAWQFTGITVSSVYAGHDGRVIVATFAPLLFYFLHRGIRTGRLIAFAGAAATLGGALLSFQIQSNYYLLLGGAIWAIFVLVHLDIVKNPTILAKRVALGLGAVAFGFVLAAVNYLPFIDYIPESPRGGEGGRGYEYSTSWSMDPAETWSMAVPEHAGILNNYIGANPFKLHTEYVGALVVVLLVLGFLLVRKNRYWWFFGGLSLFFLTICFGGHTPLYRLYFAVLPGTQMFRAPSIAFFMVAMSVVAMGAITLERLAERIEEADAPDLTRWLLGIGGVTVAALVLAVVASGSDARDAARVVGYARFTLFTTLICAILWLWSKGKWDARAVALGLAIVTFADLWLIDRNFYETIPPPEQTFAQDDVAAFLAQQPGPFRTWALPFPAGSVYQGGGNYLMLFDIDQAGGEHPNQLQRFNEFVGAGEQTYVDWSNFLESANFLRAANVRYIVSLVELETPFLREVHRGSAIIYENVIALPRAYLVGRTVTAANEEEELTLLADPSFDPAQAVVVSAADPALTESASAVTGEAVVRENDPDRVVVETQSDQSAILVLADNYYHGWRATVDGEEALIHRANHTFRAVQVPAGRSEVVFTYAPTQLEIGFYVYLAAMLALASYVSLWTVQRYRQRSEVA